MSVVWLFLGTGRQWDNDQRANIKNSAEHNAIP